MFNILQKHNNKTYIKHHLSSVDRYVETTSKAFSHVSHNLSTKHVNSLTTIYSLTFFFYFHLISAQKHPEWNLVNRKANPVHWWQILHSPTVEASGKGDFPTEEIADVSSSIIFSSAEDGAKIHGHDNQHLVKLSKHQAHAIMQLWLHCLYPTEYVKCTSPKHVKFNKNYFLF